MRILVDGMPRTIGGIGSLILSIAEVAKIRNDDISFDFIISEHSEYIPILKKKGYTYFIVPRFKDLKKYKKCITDIFKNYRYDYLWFNNTSKVNIVLPETAKRIGGTRIITHPHGVDYEEKGFKKRVFKIVSLLHEKRMFSLIDVPFTCSEQAADVYYKHNKKIRESTKVIRNGIFAPEFAFSMEKRIKIRTELGVSENDIVLGAVGRLTKVKNYSFLIDLLNNLPNHYKLIIIGEGEDYDVLKDQILKMKETDRCSLLGKKSNINEYLSAMDFFLMPSFNEGMPYSIVEAQASGLRCIVSDTLSRDLAITDLVDFASISDPKQWINYIKNSNNAINRFDYVDRIIDAGYSIENSYDVFIDSLKRFMKCNTQ